MRSVYAKISLWSFATLAVSLVAFLGVTAVVSYQASHKTGQFGQIHSMELEQAREAFEAGGASRLEAFLTRMHRYIHGQHYLTDGSGRDVLTGEDRAALVASAQAEGSRPRWIRGPMVVMATAADGKYRWITVMPAPPMDITSYLPYYAVIFGAVALMCWLLAMNIASPLRDFTRTVERFGAGDLAVRVNSMRRDEIGELSRVFDRMAERMGTLLTAERRLLQDVSHELRSPLARLSFAAELIRSADDRGAAVERLKREIRRLTDLVDALLQVTRAEGDPSATAFDPLILNELASEVVNDCRLEAEVRGCTLSYGESVLVEVRGDRELLRRAVENVVRNSIRYAPEKSEVRVTLDGGKEAATLTVRDQGPGVPEEALGKIFQPFFRVDESRDGATGGVGLGLAIAKRAVAVHYGRLWARNSHPGLEVCIELPAKVRETFVKAGLLFSPRKTRTEGAEKTI